MRPTRLKEAWNLLNFFVFSLDLAPNTSEETLKGIFQNKMIVALEELYTDDKGIYFRHQKEPERLAIYTTEDMPDAVRHLKHFFCFDRDNYFSSRTTEKARTARGMACIAATGDVAPIVKECHTDVKIKSVLSFWKQDLPVWEMMEEINLVCESLKIPANNVK